MPITTCIFDMGNVLVHFSHDRMCRNVAAACQVPEEHVRELLIGRGLQWQLERGEITEQQFHADVEQHLGRSVDVTVLLHAMADIFWLNESMVPLLSELRELGIRLVLLSNTSITHLKFIRLEFNILDRMDAFTTSFEVGVLKPDPAIYEDALRKANCRPQDCFYTDDIEDYVLAAQTIGINAEVFTQTKLTRQALRALGVAVAAE